MTLIRYCAAAIVGLVVFASASATSGNAALVTSPSIAGAKRVTDATQIGANKFKPSQCAGLTLTTMVVVTGASGSASNGTNALVIGNGSRDQTLNGANGTDCVIAGGANTTINNSLTGGGGNDVLVGGKFADNTYNGNGGSDTCYYRANDAVPSSGNCETRTLLP